jgi:UDP-glucose 4-epimerase
MKTLITGAAGYIGSHALSALRRAGHEVVALDNLSRGHREAVPRDVPFVACDVGDRERIEQVLREHRIDGVMHFAAYALVSESVADPALYFRNNTVGTLGLLEAMQAARVRKLVFSSTCATYGVPSTLPIHEELPQVPINPYGASKLASERMMQDLCRATPELAITALRYFNVAGAAEDGTLGEDHEPETHLIPSIFLAVVGRRDKITVFGDDYPTPDGTCIRDYVHVEDVAEAHVVALEKLQPGFVAYNLGIGRGDSVKQIVAAVEAVVGRRLPVEMGPRRPGDPPMLYADPRKIERALGWRARRTDLRETIASAWRWFERNPRGYAGGAKDRA